MNRDLESIAWDFIKENNMLKGESVIAVGVSGGADSVCLLHLLNTLKDRIGAQIVVIHVNHLLRGDDSYKDEKFTKALAGELGLLFECERINVREFAAESRMSLEEAGRAARFDVFERAIKQLSFKNPGKECLLALAHHGDDNAETLLLNMARGTGVNGMRGIRPVASRDGLKIIRPLLCSRHSEILSYLDENEIDYVEDESNADVRFARNRVRLNILPEMEKLNPRASEHINELSKTFTQIESFVNEQIEAASVGVIDVRENDIAIDAKKLGYLHGAIQNGIIYKAIAILAGTQKDITHGHVESVLALKGKQTGRKIELPYALEALRSYNNIILRRSGASLGEGIRGDLHAEEGTENITVFMDDVKAEDQHIELAGGAAIIFKIVRVDDFNRENLVTKKTYIKAFDCDKIKGDLILGAAKAYDEITFAGGKKSLKKFFVDEKIPHDERSRIPVLKDSEGVLWIVGYRIGERYKITASTREALLVSIKG